ncbi:hypothetical protein [Nocardioides sp.]|uniref:hypothetical protein n=1 Tax=Nocardioides sp. TaxID=35761 RepID=UPI0025FF5CDB|nr:hypothetical protein [Nocardioides sp.]
MQFPWQPRPRPRAPRAQVEPIRLDPAADVEVQRKLVARLTAEQLTAAWYLSGDALQAARDPRRAQQLVVLRGLMLDALEQRDPVRYDRWLRAGGPPVEAR